MRNSKEGRIEELLLEGRMYGDNYSPGNFLSGLLTFLTQHVPEDSIACEIGSFRGKSSELFALHVKTLFCVDLWTPYSVEYDDTVVNKAEAEFDLMRENYQNIVKLKSDSVDAALMFPNNFFDLIYVDADHDETPFRKDMTAWIPKVKMGGIISGHDYFFVRDYLRSFHRDQGIMVFEDESWFFIKK